MNTPARRLALLLTLTGCNDYLFEQKCPQQLTEQSIEQPAAEPTPADILFVVDNSGSMADEQENLALNFEAFIREIAGAGNYQIMVVTTDTTSSEGEQTGKLEAKYFNDATQTLEIFDDLACVPANIEHGCARGPDPAKRIIKSSELREPADQIAAFQQNVLVGSCGSGTEQGLAAMKLALQKARGGCNDGFLREGANLVVVIVSDEQDQDNIPVEQYVSDLAAMNIPYSRIRVATVVGSVDGRPANCRISGGVADDGCGSLCRSMPAQGSRASCTVNNNSIPCPSGEFCEQVASNDPMGLCQNQQLKWWNVTDACAWCSYYKVDDCCSALSGSRYTDFAKMVEARVVAEVDRIPPTGCTGRDMNGEQPIACLIDSICQESFSDTLARIARELVVIRELKLTPAPVFAGGVVVRLKNGRFPAEGKELVFGSDYKITNNSDGTATLTLEGDNVPVQGENIEIYYVTDRASDAPKVGACGTTP